MRQVEEIRLLDLSLVEPSNQSLQQPSSSDATCLSTEGRCLHLLTENSPDLITILKVDGTFSYVSPSVESILGYKWTMLVGKNIIDYLHPQDVVLHQAEFARQIQQPEINFVGEYRFQHADGSWIYLETISRNLLDNPHIKGIITNFRDITTHKWAEEQLKESQKKYRSVMNSIKEVIFQTDANGFFIFLNPAWTEITDFTVEETLGKDFFSYIHPEDRQLNAELFQPLIERTAAHCQHIIRYLIKGGGYRWIEVVARLTLEENDNIAGISGTLSDVTERKYTELLEKDRNHVLEMITSSATLPDILAQIAQMVKRQGLGIHCNVLLLHPEDGKFYHAITSNLAYDLIQAADLIAMEPVLGAHEKENYYRKTFIVPDIVNDPRWEKYREVALTHRLRAWWSVPILSSHEEVLGTFAIYYHEPKSPTQKEQQLLETASRLAAIAIEQRRLNDQLSYQAHHDALTGLPNRILFEDRLQQALAQAQRHTQENVGVLFVDLNRFKQVNDTLGHAVGDSLLQQVGERLQHCLRHCDTVARIGGDEFTIILSELKNPQYATQIAEKLQKVIEEPFIIKGHELFITASIGISLYPDDGTTVPELLRKADAAMYQIKEESKKPQGSVTTKNKNSLYINGRISHTMLIQTTAMLVQNLGIKMSKFFKKP
ncbi:MAG: diguanylate cyclase [Chloroflexi bacterium]|nr:diguanylate cyclase [Chloroflexota bacterium]